MTFTGGKNRMVGTRNDLHGELVRVRFVCRRKVYLNVIDAWLNKKRPLDEYVIDGLSKYLFILIFAIDECFD